MVKRILAVLVMQLTLITAMQVVSTGNAEARDVWAYTAPNQQYTVYVISESVGFTANNTLKCRTKTVRGMEYELAGWELKQSGDDYYYRVCESESKKGLVPVEGTWYLLDSEEMLCVFNTCADCLQ
ncbi:hypothetical protein [Anaerovibrio lipolyticus]|uniref:hypothetical protein n=1 Tax=Anaerovibrio lipolyticus TaxID=82374 RepID=UPI0023F0A34E|nr:hypothetical protein [Anaerovibrio lipolyticus]